MTYTEFVKRMNEFRANVAPMTPLITARFAGIDTGLTTTQARAYLERMSRERKALREQPMRKVFYTIGGMA